MQVPRNDADVILRSLYFKIAPRRPRKEASLPSQDLTVQQKPCLNLFVGSGMFAEQNQQASKSFRIHRTSVYNTTYYANETVHAVRHSCLMSKSLDVQESWCI